MKVASYKTFNKNFFSEFRCVLKRTQKQVEIGYRVYIYKTTCIHSESILAVSPQI